MLSEQISSILQRVEQLIEPIQVHDLLPSIIDVGGPSRGWGGAGESLSLSWVAWSRAVAWGPVASGRRGVVDDCPAHVICAAEAVIGRVHLAGERILGAVADVGGLRVGAGSVGRACVIGRAPGAPIHRRSYLDRMQVPGFQRGFVTSVGIHVSAPWHAGYVKLSIGLRRKGTGGPGIGSTGDAAVHEAQVDVPQVGAGA